MDFTKVMSRNINKMPDFPEDEMVRYRIVLREKYFWVVLKMGFAKMINQLNFTGWMNFADKDSVEIIIQGMNNKVAYFLDKLEKNKCVEIMEKKSIPVCTIEQTFMVY
ncbi:MAG: hypothetical protein UH963_06400 [Agathobacter sp.]|nr:hypothetical protein [Agathobacter sp.]